MHKLLPKFCFSTFLAFISIASILANTVLAYTWTYSPALVTSGSILNAATWNNMVNSIQETKTALDSFQTATSVVGSYVYPYATTNCSFTGVSLSRQSYASSTSSLPSGYTSAVNYCGKYQIDPVSDSVRYYNGSYWTSLYADSIFSSMLSNGCTRDILGSKFEGGYIKIYMIYTQASDCSGIKAVNYYTVNVNVT